jgi:UTP--glucose-1-phosphate uridylyltransferase
MLQYVIEEIVASGIEAITVITARGKSALEDYFDRHLELERSLSESGKTALLQEVQRASTLARFTYIRQGDPRGLGHAVLTARPAVGRSPFAVILPDDIIVSQTPAVGQLVQAFHKYGGSVVAVEEVPMERISAYGVVDASHVEGNVFRVHSVVEKPPADKAPSNLAIVGRYVFTPELFDALDSTSPGAGGEIQLTDGMTLLMKEQPLFACRLTGTRYDGGNPFGLLQASLEFALARDDLRSQTESLIKRLAAKLK